MLYHSFVSKRKTTTSKNQYTFFHKKHVYEKHEAQIRQKLRNIYCFSSHGCLIWAAMVVGNFKNLFFNKSLSAKLKATTRQEASRRDKTDLTKKKYLRLDLTKY